MDEIVIIMLVMAIAMFFPILIKFLSRWWTRARSDEYHKNLISYQTALGLDKIKVIIMGPDCEEARLRVPPKIPIIKLLELALEKFQSQPGKYQTTHNGKKLPLNSTVGELGIRTLDRLYIVRIDNNPSESDLSASVYDF